MIIIFWAIFVSILTKTTSQQPPCGIYVTANPQTSSLVVTSYFEFPDPAYNHNVMFPFGVPAFFACPGGRFGLPGMNPNGQSGTCRGGDLFNAKGLSIFYDELNCTLSDLTRPDLSESYDNPDIYCENRTRPLEVGYSIAGNLASVLTICFDMNRFIPLYTKHRLTSWARLAQNHRSPPSYYFFLVEFYTENAELPYNNITATFEYLGLQQYINEEHYLVKGHLAPYEDFYYPFQRDATYHLANVAPRWNTIDQGNWKALEDALVVLAETEIFGNDATVLTGTLDVATLTNSNGMPVELYLTWSRYAVPKWFWKLIYFPTSKAGALFFGYNNPYAQKLNVDFEFITKVCSVDAFYELQQTWTVLKNIKKDDPSLGLLYACRLVPDEISDPVIREIVTNVNV